MKENSANSIINTMEKRENGIKTLMWGFLMDKGQQSNIPALKEYVYDLIQMTTQKSAGQNEKLQAKGHIDWKTLDMTLMSIVIEATALVLSGDLDRIEMGGSSGSDGQALPDGISKTEAGTDVIASPD